VASNAMRPTIDAYDLLPAIATLCQGPGALSSSR
jgi:hypothetical protein